MKYASLILSCTCFLSFASASTNDVAHLPKSFGTKEGKAVFADFSTADYEITFDLDRSKAMVKAKIEFDLTEAGFPIFDSVMAPTQLWVDGVETKSTEESTPDQETKLRVAKKLLSPGKHRFEMTLPLEDLVKFSDGGVNSAFWTSDLKDRSFLERYLPANFEFDQVKMSFLVKFVGGSGKQSIYTNGTMKELDPRTHLISFPEYFTSSSIFFHTVPQDSVEELRFTLKSIDGRVLPAVVYRKPAFFARTLEFLKRKTEETFHDLERDLGAFPHPSVTVYNAGSGGMEYCGATMTDMGSLSHELFHSYFARGVMPANGNAGWLDEALASWHDAGYASRDALGGYSQMSSHPYYTRETDQAAYGFGEKFMAYLDGKLTKKGGLMPFLRNMVKTRRFHPIFVEDFIGEMNAFYGISFEQDFKTYTYGKSASLMELPETQKSEIHQKMDLRVLEELL